MDTLMRTNGGNRLMRPPMGDMLSSLVDEFLAPGHAGGWPAMDAYSDEQGVHVTLELPGMKPEDVDITFEDDILNVEGERQATFSGERRGGRLMERRYGRFSRSLRIGVPVDRDGIDARFENGLLTIDLPRSEEARPRKIEVRAGEEVGSSSRIEAESSSEGETKDNG